MGNTNIKWVDLQKRIELIFTGTRVKSFKDVLEKDGNGWNWVLNFEDLRTDNELIVHTKLIFKLDSTKNYLRKLEFLYLKDINCLYKIVRFDSLGDLENVINDIINNDMFGENLLAISNLMVDPETKINNYLYENKIGNKSVYLFEYLPMKTIIPCQDLEFNFNININNNIDIKFKLKKIEKNDFDIIFNNGREKYIVEQKTLNNLIKVIGEFIINKV
jgi:hypothetical protein